MPRAVNYTCISLLPDRARQAPRRARRPDRGNAQSIAADDRGSGKARFGDCAIRSDASGRSDQAQGVSTAIRLVAQGRDAATAGRRHCALGERAGVVHGLGDRALELTQSYDGGKSCRSSGLYSPVAHT